ncbi:MAG: hypothetical protein IJ894_10835 [Bacteroidales bacterium]|jgi:hypothetical protein|nr:hypothetical protein [Bacteroidales bacterium]
MKKSRQALRPPFANGKKPPQQDFYDWQDSYYHLDDDIPANKVFVQIDGNKRDIVSLINKNTQDITNIKLDLEWAEL